MATYHEETLQQRYLRVHNEYVAMVKRMTPDQIMALHVELADVTAQRDQLLEAMKENVAELKRDSERYIWLISQESWEPPRDALPEWYGGKIKWLGGDYSIDEINKIIDEARCES